MIHLAAAFMLLSAQAPAPVSALPAAPPPVPVPKPPVPTAEHHQFDFWLGEWEVKDPAGSVVGHNRIESMANGFGLLENWTDTVGGSGKSVNAYDPAAKGWHQTWVGSGGAVIKFDGGIVEGKMRMEGIRQTAKGPVRDRMTWTPEINGTVRQVWDISADEGKTWKTIFEGIYSKVKSTSF